LRLVVRPLSAGLLLIVGSLASFATWLLVRPSLTSLLLLVWLTLVGLALAPLVAPFALLVRVGLSLSFLPGLVLLLALAVPLLTLLVGILLTLGRRDDDQFLPFGDRHIRLGLAVVAGFGPVLDHVPSLQLVIARRELPP